MKLWVVYREFVSGPHRSYGAVQHHLNAAETEGICGPAHEIAEAATRPLTCREREADALPDAEWPYE